MLQTNKILFKIKEIVSKVEPGATVILYGSFARGEQKKNSDIDLLILVNQDVVTFADEKRIKYPLYDLEFETGYIISPLVFSKKDWENRHKITPFYKNVNKEGIFL